MFRFKCTLMAYPSHPTKRVIISQCLLIQGGVAGTGTKEHITNYPGETRNPRSSCFRGHRCPPANQVLLEAEYKRHRLKVCHSRQVYLIYNFNSSQVKFKGDELKTQIGEIQRPEGTHQKYLLSEDIRDAQSLELCFLEGKVGPQC